MLVWTIAVCDIFFILGIHALSFHEIFLLGIWKRKWYNWENRKTINFFSFTQLKQWALKTFPSAIFHPRAATQRLSWKICSKKYYQIRAVTTILLTQMFLWVLKYFPEFIQASISLMSLRFEDVNCELESISLINKKPHLSSAVKLGFIVKNGSKPKTSI